MALTEHAACEGMRDNNIFIQNHILIYSLTIVSFCNLPFHRLINVRLVGGKSNWQECWSKLDLISRVFPPGWVWVGHSFRDERGARRTQPCLEGHVTHYIFNERSQIRYGPDDRSPKECRGFTIEMELFYNLLSKN